MKVIRLFLDVVRTRITSGKYVFTTKAKTELELEDLDESFVLSAILGLTEADFHHELDGSTGTLWVFFVRLERELFYVKLTIDDRGCVIISFHPSDYEEWK